MATRDELLGTLVARYREASRAEKGRILTEFAAATGYHRKHAARLLRATTRSDRSRARPERRLYDEAVREALIVILPRMGGGFWQGLRTWRGAWDGGSETAARVPRGVHGARRWSGCATCAMTLVAVANELGLHETVLRRWIQKHGEPGMGLARRSSTAASSGPSPADLAAETARLKRAGRPALDGDRDIGRMAALVRGTRPPDEVWASGMSTGTSGRSPSCAACWGCPSAATRAWRSRPESARSRANRALLDDVRLAHAEIARRAGAAPGAPRVHAVLRHPRPPRRAPPGGPPGSRRAGLRGLAALPRRVRTTEGRHGHPIAPNRIGRSFEAARPNQVWLGDLTPAFAGAGSACARARAGSRGLRGPTGATVPAHASPRSSRLAHPQDRRLGHARDGSHGPDRGGSPRDGRPEAAPSSRPDLSYELRLISSGRCELATNGSRPGL